MNISDSFWKTHPRQIFFYCLPEWHSCLCIRMLHCFQIHSNTFPSVSLWTEENENSQDAPFWKIESHQVTMIWLQWLHKTLQLAQMYHKQLGSNSEQNVHAWKPAEIWTWRCRFSLLNSVLRAGKALACYRQMPNSVWMQEFTLSPIYTHFHGILM